MTSSYYLKWTEMTRNCKFCSNCGRGYLGTQTNFKIFSEFGLLQVKWWYNMFSSKKMEEYMEPELFSIFWVKLVAINIVPGSLRTHFIDIRVNSAKEIGNLLSFWYGVCIFSPFRFWFLLLWSADSSLSKSDICFL